MDRLHRQRGGAAAARTPRDLRREATHRRDHPAELEPTHGGALGTDRGRRHGGGGRFANPPAGSGWALLRSAGCLRPDRRGGRTLLPPGRELPDGTAGGNPRDRGGARVRIRTGARERRDRRGGRHRTDAPAAPDHRHGGQGLVERLHPHPHELRRQPPQHPREPDVHVRRRGPGRGARADRQQGQPDPRLPALRARGRRSPALDRRDGAGRGSGVPPAVLRPRLLFRPRRTPDLALHHGVRRHRDREPLSVQHRHVPEGEGPGSDRRLRARLLRGKRSTGRPRREPREPRRREGLHRGCGPRRNGRGGVVLGLAGRVLPLVRHPEQRSPGHGRGWRGLHQQHAAVQTGGIDPHLRSHRGAGAGSRRLPRRNPGGQGRRELRAAARLPGERADPGGRRAPSRVRR